MSNKNNHDHNPEDKNSESMTFLQNKEASSFCRKGVPLKPCWRPTCWTYKFWWILHVCNRVKKSLQLLWGITCTRSRMKRNTGSKLKGKRCNSAQPARLKSHLSYICRGKTRGCSKLTLHIQNNSSWPEGASCQEIFIRWNLIVCTNLIETRWTRRAGIWTQAVAWRFLTHSTPPQALTLQKSSSNTVLEIHCSRQTQSGGQGVCVIHMHHVQIYEIHIIFCKSKLLLALRTP